MSEDPQAPDAPFVIEVTHAQEYHDVEKVNGHAYESGRLLVLLRWAGFDASHDKWEFADENMYTCPMIQEYMIEHGLELFRVRKCSW